MLDAGCGPGVYTEWLVSEGADVVGVDVSPKMVQLATARLQGRARIQRADFGKPLDFLDDGSFDIVVSPLALDYVWNWDRVFSEFFRVLRVDGQFVFSVSHLSDEFYEHHPSGNYFEIEQVQYTYNWERWGVRIDVPHFRRPLNAMVNPLIEAGFALKKLLEPQPLLEFEQEDPAGYLKLMRQPGFVCFRARKG